jgi:hypothetical protein
MKELLSWTVSQWNLYWGSGYYPYLLLLSLLYLLIFKRKKNGIRDTLPFVLILLFLFFCPLSASVISRCLGTDVYWRVLWLLPVIPIIALAATELLHNLHSRITHCILLILFVGVIAFCGKGMMEAGSYVKLANYQKVPNEVPVICEIIREKAAEDQIDEIRIATDDYLSAYLLVYDPSLLMPYGRGGQGALTKAAAKLYEEISSERPRYKRLARLAAKSECNFLVLPEAHKAPNTGVGVYHYVEIGQVATYKIFELQEES